MRPKYLTCDVTHKKHETQNQKVFFSLQSRRLAESFKGSSTIDWQVMELQSGMKIATHAGILGTMYLFIHWQQSC